MIVLAIESSCDETALSLVELGASGCATVLAHKLSSQVSIHAAFGGVVPEVAAREHLSQLPALYHTIAKECPEGIQNVDYVAATQGPGLKGCLLLGFSFGHALSHALGKPFIGVHHIEAHVLSPLLEHPEIAFPFLSLVVSGGHTEIQLVKEVGSYELVARTTDDAAGEAFDKAANLLGFSYPGGAALSKCAQDGTVTKGLLPTIRLSGPRFSFSGLKTAMSRLIDEQWDEIESSPKKKADICACCEAAIVESLLFKVREATEELGINRWTLCGGVAANSTLRRAMEEHSHEFYVPSQEYCTDNAAMIALTAALRITKGFVPESGSPAEVYPRLPLEEYRRAS